MRPPEFGHVLKCQILKPYSMFVYYAVLGASMIECGGFHAHYNCITFVHRASVEPVAHRTLESTSS